MMSIIQVTTSRNFENGKHKHHLEEKDPFCPHHLQQDASTLGNMSYSLAEARYHLQSIL